MAPKNQHDGTLKKRKRNTTEPPPHKSPSKSKAPTKFAASKKHKPNSAGKEKNEKPTVPVTGRERRIQSKVTN